MLPFSYIQAELEDRVEDPSRFLDIRLFNNIEATPTGFKHRSQRMSAKSKKNTKKAVKLVTMSMPTNPRMARSAKRPTAKRVGDFTFLNGNSITTDVSWANSWKDKMSSKIATDGINRGVTLTNKSRVVDTFSRSEKIATISGTSAFTIAQALYLNPGNSSLCPVFSQTAQNYQKFRWRKLRFRYVTTAYAASSSGSAGRVIGATNYDPDAPEFVDDTEMENYVGAVRAAPFAPVVVHDVDCNHDSIGELYVNPSVNTAVPSTETSTPAKFYNLGLFQFATVGNAITTEVGELFVDFLVDMIEPLQIAAGPSFGESSFGHVSTNGTSTAAAPLTSATVSGNTTASITVLTNTTLSVVVPPYSNLYIYGVYISSNITAVPTFTSSLLTNLNAFNGGSANSEAAVVASTSGWRDQAWQNATANTVTTVITLGGATSMASSSIDLFFSVSPSSILAVPHTGVGRSIMMAYKRRILLQKAHLKARLARKETLVMDTSTITPPCEVGNAEYEILQLAASSDKSSSCGLY